MVVMLFKLMGYLLLWTLLLAPTINFMLIYTIFYGISVLYVVYRHMRDDWTMFGFGVLLIILWGTFWYLLQARELKRFYQQQDAEKKEIKAVTREIEVTNVLNLQQNAIIIFSPGVNIFESDAERPVLRIMAVRRSNSQISRAQSYSTST